MTRIAHIITNLATGGAEAILLKLIEGTDRDFEHVVISLMDEGTMAKPLRDAGATVHALGMSKGRASIWASIKLMRLLHRMRPDLLQGWMYHGNMAATVGQLCLPSKPALAWSIHCAVHSGNQRTLLNRIVLYAGQRLSRRPSAIIYNSARSRTEHELLGYDGRSSALIENGFDTSRFKPDSELRATMRERLGISREQLVVGQVARLDPVKDHGTFLKAAVEAAKSDPRLTFVIAGRGVPGLRESSGARDAVQRLGSRLLLLDEIADVAALYNAMDLSVLCSLSESFPNVIGEAMSSGVPCISTDVGECGVIISDTGLIVPPNEPSKLAASIAALAARTDLRSLGLKARDRIIEKYSITSLVWKHHEIWRALLKGDIRSVI